MTNWNRASAKAAKTAKWATTMTKWLLSQKVRYPKWQMVAFTGPRGRESAGIVDLLAVRKDHRTFMRGSKQGDLFEIVLIQVKGGNAQWPSWNELVRLQSVRRYYGAKAVVLAYWQKGRQPRLYRLKNKLHKGVHPKNAWVELASSREVFN